MLYLAEVQKQRSGGVFGSSKAEFKLLACQRGEQNWTAVTGDEVIMAEEANSFSPGSLVLVELNEKSKQLQRVLEDSPRKLVSILQTFSKVQERVKIKEEEIEQWKQSLTFQSQELNRRELEMQGREDELAQMGDELERLDRERQEVDRSKQESQRLREEAERGRQEIEQAWADFHVRMQELDEKSAAIQQATVLDGHQSEQIRGLLDQVGEAIAPIDTLKESVHLCQAKINDQQGLLQQYWQQLDQKRSEAQRHQDEAERLSRDVQQKWQDWQKIDESLLQARTDWQGQRLAFAMKQEQLQAWKLQHNLEDEAYQKLCQMAKVGDGAGVSDVNVQALEKMPIDELQRLVQDLHHDLQKVLSFVRDQEEELKMQQETMDELSAKIKAASEYDRLNLEAELAEEQESYEMLNESLVGSQRNLQKKEQSLSLHQSILKKRLGHGGESGAQAMDLVPIVNKLTTQRQQQLEIIHKLEAELGQMQHIIDQTEGSINHQIGEHQARRREIEQLEANWRNQIKVAAESATVVRLYEELLQPVQDRIDEMRQKLEEVMGILHQVQEKSYTQANGITELKGILAGVLSQ